MTRETVEQVMKALLSASKELNEALLVVQTAASESEFVEYRRRAGEIIAAIYLDLMKPIVRSYPDLDPGRDDG
jgi:hypothetical protein